MTLCLAVDVLSWIVGMAVMEIQSLRMDTPSLVPSSFEVTHTNKLFLFYCIKYLTVFLNAVMLLLSPLLLLDVCKTIRDYAFKTTPYPVVLSIENHCCYEQQQMLAQIMKKVFREMLLLPQDYPSGMLPSPNELVNKILVKGKRAKAAAAIIEQDDEEDEDEDDDDDDEATKQSGAGTATSGASSPLTRSQSAAAKAKAKAALIEKRKKLLAKSKRPKKDKKVDIHPELSEVVFLGTTHAKSLGDAANAAVACDLMSSFSEIKTLKQLRKPPIVADWLKYNRKHLR